MIEEKKLAEMKAFAENLEPDVAGVTIPGPQMAEIAGTALTLWKIVRAAQEHVRTHGHTTDSSMEDALIEAGLSDPTLAAWRTKLKRNKP